MNKHTKKIIEAFDFDSINKQKNPINAYDALLPYILEKVKKQEKITEKEYYILISFNAVYEVEDKDTLEQLIKYFIKNFGNRCNLNWIDVSNVTDMLMMFQNSEFNGDISNWDVSNVKDMNQMFRHSLFNGDISKWDVSNVTDMQQMFSDSKFNGDISQWDVSNVTNMYCMFARSEFNGDISQWDVSNVTFMGSMFEESKFNGDISQWDVSNVKNMFNMFAFSKFNRDISKWNIKSNCIMMDMYDKCPIKKIYMAKKRRKKLTEAFDFNSVNKHNKKVNVVDALLQPIIWKIDNERELSQDDYDILKNCVGIYKVSEHAELKDLIKYFINQFGDKCNLNWINTSKIADMSYMFQMSVFNGDISLWDVSNVTDMSYMFVQSYFNGNISNWDVSNVKNMQGMFKYSKFNGDISKWDVSSVTTMEYMFESSVFNGDISNWDVSSVTNMHGMFCDSIFNQDISNWNVCNVENMKSIFEKSSFTGDISNWNINPKCKIDNMYIDCHIKRKYRAKKRKKLAESFDFNQVKNDKNKKLSQSIVNVMEDPHYAQVGDYLYRDIDGKYTLREIDVPWGICAIEAKDTPDNKARFMGLKNATCEPIIGMSRSTYSTKGLCVFGGNQDIFNEYYVDYFNPESSWNGAEISQAIYNAGRIDKKVKGISYDAVNFCKEYDVHRTEKNWMKAPETGWYCPAYSELWKGTTPIINYIKEHPDDPRLEELNFIFNKFYIYGIWSCSMFKKEGTFGYYITGHKMQGFQKKVGWQREAAFVALPFISF